MMRLRSVLPVLALTVLSAANLPAQDTTRAVLRLLYDNPRIRPGLVVLPAPGLDSVRTIIERDLDHSDRFEMIYLPTGMAVSDTGINWAPYRAMNAVLAVGVTPAPVGAGVVVRLYEVASGLPRDEGTWGVDVSGQGAARMAVHRISDEIVRWATGTAGIAATRVLYVQDNRVWLVDADGHSPHPITPAGRTAYSPSWSPDARRIVYTELAEGKGYIVLQTLSSGTRSVFPTSQTTMNITPAFSPDGTRLAFSRVIDGVYVLHQANLADMCCVERLTTGRFAENLSPTYSPDGRRIAFVSTRAGSPQIYITDADGTNQELLVPFDYGISGASFAPDWSPDGLQVVFHRSAPGGFQVMVHDLTSGRVRQITSEGRNEDASWAPDGRHIVFTSNRSGRRQMHVLDLETSRVRMIPTSGTAQLASWSPRLTGMP